MAVLPVYQRDLPEQLGYRGLLQLWRVEDGCVGGGVEEEADDDAHEEDGAEDQEEAPVLPPEFQTWHEN